ncbi:MAG: type II toxin-antitoxin system HicA family toxin [Bacillota bacterium]
MSGDDVVRALRRVGYSVARQRGSHMRLVCPGRKAVTVPRHRELKPGLLRRILADAGLSLEEFVRLLD